MKLSTREQNRLRQRYGSTALITGASSGIGQALARLLAEASFHLVIHGRDEKRLGAIRDQLRLISGSDVAVVAADLADPSGVQQVLDVTKDKPIGLMIASAGFGTSGPLINSDAGTEANMLRVNSEALFLLTHHFARKFAQQRKGGIVLMSSMVAFQGVPYSAHYAATKAYVQSLAEGMATELKQYNVDVLAAAPGPVHSRFGSRANLHMAKTMDPDQIAVPILKSLGRKTTVLPGGLTKLLVYSLRTVPRWAKIKIMGKVMQGMTRHQPGSAEME